MVLRSAVSLQTGEFELAQEDVAYHSLVVTFEDTVWEEVDDVLLVDGGLTNFSIYPDRLNKEVVMLSPGWASYRSN